MFYKWNNYKYKPMCNLEMMCKLQIDLSFLACG